MIRLAGGFGLETALVNRVLNLGQRKSSGYKIAHQDYQGPHEIT